MVSQAPPPFLFPLLFPREPPYILDQRGDAMKHDTLAPWAEPVPDVAYPFTADALLGLREDEWRYELVDGRLVRMAPTGLEHLVSRNVSTTP